MLKEDYINLHQIPELGFKENKTSTYLKKRLINTKAIVKSYNTGICAFFDFKKDKTIAFRAEEDALPIKDKTNLIYKSNVNMHACGHDAHMAILLNFGDFINSIKDYKYNILLIFQPSEEQIGGSLFMLPYLKEYNIKLIIGLHVFPFLKKGKVYSSSTKLFASSVELDILIKGKASHVYNYKKENDALVKSIKIINKMKKETKRLNMFLHVGYLKSGVKRNICPNKSIIKISLRSKDELSIKKYLETLTNTDQIKYKYSKIIKSVENSYSNKIELMRDLNVIDLKKTFYLVDDFAYYSSYYETMFFLLGTDGKYFLHSDKFALCDDDLENGYNFIKKLFFYFQDH